MMSTEELRVVFYSHDSQGLGHTRRNLALAHAMARDLPALTGRTVTGLMLTGVDSATSHGKPAGFDWVVLPGVSKGRHGYGPRHLNVGMEHVTRLRSSMLRAALLGFRPHLVVVDRHAWGVDRELEEPLRSLRATFPETRIVLGLREVLDDPRVTAREWAAAGPPEQLRGIYDQIWVYGDPEVHDPVATGEIPGALVDLVRHTGYLAAGRPLGERTTAMSSPYVVSMAGGGSDGTSMLSAAAALRLPHGHRHLVITGPQMPEAAVNRIRAAAAPGTTVVASVPDALVEVVSAEAVISMGGYNSTAEILTTNTPALIVPREEPRREQLIRARALAACGAVDLMRLRDATPEAMTSWVRSAVGTVCLRRNVDLHGLRAVGHLAAEALAGGPGSPSCDPEPVLARAGQA